MQLGARSDALAERAAQRHGPEHRVPQSAASPATTNLELPFQVGPFFALD
jgi:hypothetical protein